jgi:mannitol-1-phosphate/altronate dehydrogenase
LWRRKVGSEITEDVAVPLIALADLCQLLSDRSHETFQPIDITLSEKIESNLSVLRDAVVRMRESQL